MNFKSFVRENFVRLLAVICLLIGLGDAARALGATGGAASPVHTYGVAGFVFLAIFAVSRLFAAVGLWIHASWGGVLLVGATLVELFLFLARSPDVHISIPGMIVRVGLMAGIVGFLGIRYWRARAHVHD